MQSLSKSLIVAEIPLLLTVFLLTEGAVWIVWIPPPSKLYLVLHNILKETINKLSTNKLISINAHSSWFKKKISNTLIGFTTINVVVLM